MTLTTRTVTNSGDPLCRPDGTLFAGVTVTFTLVTPRGIPVDAWDAQTHERVIGAVTAVTDSAGEFSVGLWPTDRSNIPVLYLCHVSSAASVRDFIAPLPSGNTPFSLAELMASGLPLTAQQLNILDTYRAGFDTSTAAAAQSAAAALAIFGNSTAVAAAVATSGANATAASGSATAAAGSASNSATSATASSTSATAAAGSASAAATSATASSTSATASAGSASNSATSATASSTSATAAAGSASGSATSAAAANASAGASAGSAASTLAIYGSVTAQQDAVATATAQASLAAGYAASAGSVAQQDLSGVTAAALHRSPNAITAMCIYDTSKDSDGGAWVERCQHTSWYNEPLNGSWLTGGFATELAARQAAGATTGSYYQLTTDGRFYAINKNLLLNTATLSTQTVWLAAGSYTLSGATASSGSVALTGSATGTFTAPTPLTFTVATAGNVTFTVTGSVTTAQCEPGASVTSHAANTAARITETFRGNKAKFPRWAAIIAEASIVTIYDLTEPGRPMWRKFIQTNRGTDFLDFWRGGRDASCLAALNGKVIWGQAGASATRGLCLVDFAADKLLRYNGPSGFGLIQAVTLASVVPLGPVALPALVNETVNAVAMTVLPDAPIDPATGLQVPTIAVGTAGGVSVIKHDGTVASHAFTWAASYDSVMLDGGWLLYGNAVNVIGYRVQKLYSISGSTFSGVAFSVSGAGSGVAFLSGSGKLGGMVVMRSVVSSNAINLLRTNPANLDASLRATIANTYSTGYMTGDIRRCLLANTEIEVVGPGVELMPNGKFDTNIDGWASTAPGIVLVEWEPSGAMKMSNTVASFGGVRCLDFPTVPGRTYIARVRLVSLVGNLTILLAYSGASVRLALLNVTALGDASITFTAVSTTSYLNISNANLSTSTRVIDNVSVQEVIPERSYKNKPLSIVGTLTKTAVALGAQLVGFSGFSDANYLQESFSADLDFGTGAWSASGWVNTTGYGPHNLLLRSETLQHAAWSSGTAGSGSAVTRTDNYLGETGVTRLQCALNGGVAATDESGVYQSVTGGVTAGMQVWAGMEVKATDATQEGKVVTMRGAARASYLTITLTSSWQAFGRAEASFNTDPFITVGLRANAGASDSANFLVRKVQVNRGTSAMPYRATVATAYNAIAPIAERSAATGSYFNIGLDGTGAIAAEIYDGTTTRRVTSSAAYNTGTWVKTRAEYTVDGTLALKVNGVQVATTTGTALLTLNNANAVLTVGNSRTLDAPFPGSIALVKSSATVPTAEQSAWMYAQEKQMFRDGAQTCLPDAGAIADLAYDDAQDKWVAVSGTNESSFTGLVRTATAPVSAGSISKVAAQSGVKLLARTTTTPGVDITMPAQNLKEELVRRAEAAAAQSKTLTVFDFDAIGFTATTTNASNQLTVVASVVGTPYVGMGITGAGIPANTTIVAISGATYTMSANATATSTLVAIGQSTFALAVGWSATEVLSAGASKREGSTKDWQRLFDGFKETIQFAVSPGSAAWVQITGKKV